MNQNTKNNVLRKIPSVDEVLQRKEVDTLVQKHTRTVVVKAVQMLLEEKRKTLRSSSPLTPAKADRTARVTPDGIEEKIGQIKMPSLKQVINATGIIIHTNLGRSPLSEDAVHAVVDAARYYSNLEFDLSGGVRGARSDHVEGLLQELTGAEGGYVVNNNAAAVLLSLNTLAQSREVIVSRGELIEIGGSFRIPDIMQQSGATLIEVGTTNRTRLADYRNAVCENTGVILKAHTSNYRVVGFTEQVDLAALTLLGSEHSIPVMFDMGSGNIISPRSLGLGDEPTVQEAVKSGVDLITFSGDKLLGGPQAGIIIGKNKYLQTIRKNPLARALRIDKLTLAALEATLKAYALGPAAIEKIPVMRMLMTPEANLKTRARHIVRRLKKTVPSLRAVAVRDVSQVGGGAYPLHDLPTWAVAIQPSALSPDALARILRSGYPPVIARICKDNVLLDMRTIAPEEDRLLVQCVTKAAALTCSAHRITP